MLAVLTGAAFLVSTAGATTQARTTGVSAANAAQWCALVIQTNTKYGTMKNKRFLPVAAVPAKNWKALVDAAVAGRSKLIAVAPAEIKTAVTHEMAWFARLKANHYSTSTPLGSWTLAEVRQITNFERTRCGIKF